LSDGALDQLEDRPRPVGVAVVEVVDADDVGVGEEGHRSGLAPEAGPALLVSAELGSDRLEGDLAPGPQVAASVDDGHAADPERLVEVDLVVAGDDVAGSGHLAHPS
jgi:hypothetical protein